MNRNFAKPREDMTPEFAPDVLEINGRKVYYPKSVHCKIAGYLPLSPDYPVDPAPDGQHWERTDKIEPNGDVGYKWVYRLVDNPPPRPRVFSKINLEAAVFKRGLLATLDAFVDAQTITNEMGDTMPLRRAYNTAQTFREDHPLFAPYLAAAKQALGVDDETADAILAEAVATEG